MKFFSKYFIVVLVLLATAINSCSVGNKVIPDPGGNVNVDTTGSLGRFTLIVTGDTSFNISIFSDSTFNSIKDDSLIILGADALTNTSVLLYFGTLSSEPGTYYTEGSPPGIATGLFLARVRVNGVTRNYLMSHGKIIIRTKDTVNKTISGSFDVNNEFAGADRTLFMRANFTVRYKD